MRESTISSTNKTARSGLGRKALIVLLISTVTTMSSASIFVIQDAEASRVGLRVLAHGGEGRVCVDSNNENAGCKFADGGTLEFEFSPGAVEVGDTFSVCDSNGCETGTNGEERAPEHVYLGGGTGGGGSNGGGSSGGGLESDIRDLCMDTLGWSADRCDTLINAGKTFLICRALNAAGIMIC